MAKLFNYFPKTFYSNGDGNSLDTVTNIITRFGFEQSLKENASAFYQYEIQDGDTPEIIAHKYYGNVERHWIVLMFNDIIDPHFDWPMESRNLVDYIEAKYSTAEYADTANTSVSGVSWAKNINHNKKFFKVITTTTGFGGTTTIEKIEMDAIAHSELDPVSNDYLLQDGSTITETITKESQTYYDYEVELNENKRKIKLLKKEFAPGVEKEFRRVIKK